MLKNDEPNINNLQRNLEEKHIENQVFFFISSGLIPLLFSPSFYVFALFLCVSNKYRVFFQSSDGFHF